MKSGKPIYKLWEWLGKVTFIIVWPGLYVLLNNTTRSRIVVSHKNEILVLQDWLGDGKWNTPGGGLHKGEDEKSTAIRELKEETGISAKVEDLRPLTKFSAKNWGFKNELHCFSLPLNSKPTIKTQRFEILRAEWVDIDELLDSRRLAKTTRTILEKWKALSFEN